MKFLTILALCLFSINSFSNDKDHKEMEKKYDKMSFEDAKKLKLEILDKKTTMIEQERTCVTNAQDKPTLKECMKKMQANEKEMKSEMKNKTK